MHRHGITASAHGLVCLVQHGQQQRRGGYAEHKQNGKQRIMRVCRIPAKLIRVVVSEPRVCVDQLQSLAPHLLSACEKAFAQHGHRPHMLVQKDIGIHKQERQQQAQQKQRRRLKIEVFALPKKLKNKIVV